MFQELYSLGSHSSRSLWASGLHQIDRQWGLNREPLGRQDVLRKDERVHAVLKVVPNRDVQSGALWEEDV